LTVLPSLTLLTHFDKRRQGVTGTGCHIWTGSRNSNGYGKISLPDVGTWYTHRIAYGITHGHVPPELDHLCGNRACFNPDHLEAVTHIHRAGHGPTNTCHAGHPWAEEGWYTNSRGRKCKACHRLTARASAQRKAARSKHDTPADQGWERE
jgi:hypothetical protein